MERFKFSNFQRLSVPIVDRYGIQYWTVEHAYQACKTLNEQERMHITSLPTPGQAKKAGRQVTLRLDWEEVKLHVMWICLLHKFTYCHEHNNALREHPDEEIVELNYWHDNYWGSCTCTRCGNKGLNNLGKMIEQIKALHLDDKE